MLVLCFFSACNSLLPSRFAKPTNKRSLWRKLFDGRADKMDRELVVISYFLDVCNIGWHDGAFLQKDFNLAFLLICTRR
jgi:hypothetical protein